MRKVIKDRQIEQKSPEIEEKTHDLFASQKRCFLEKDENILEIESLKTVKSW